MPVSKQFRSAVGRVWSSWRLRGPDSGCETLSAIRAGCLVLRVDAVLTEQGAEPLGLGGELLASLGQIRQRRVRGGSLLLPRGLGGQQFLLLVTQRRGQLKFLDIDGLLPLATHLVDLLVQVAGVRPGAHALLDGCQPPLDLLQASLHSRQQPEFLRGRPGRYGLFSRVSVPQLDDRLAHPVEGAAQLDQHLRGHAVALTAEAEQAMLAADVAVAELLRLTPR